MDVFMKQIAELYKNRKIIVAWPSGEKLDYRFTNSLIELIAANLPVLNLGLSNSISSRVAVNRNACVDRARQLEGTDILWLDGDIKFPTNGLVRLLAHDKDIVGATTRRRDHRGEPIGVAVDPNQDGILLEMKLIGMPFMLTKMSVFDRLQRPYFAEPPRHMLPEIDDGSDELVGEDEYFCATARKAGMRVWCDRELSTEIGHVTSEVKYIDQKYIVPATSDGNIDEEL